MRRLAVIAAAALSLAAHAAERDLPADIRADWPEIRALYEHLHANPELSFQEKETAARLAKEMRAIGFDVTEGVGGHGVVCVYENGPGPTIMLRCDTDALPVEERTGAGYASTRKMIEQTGQEVSVMHACGHDTHMAAWVGTAKRLVRMKGEWSGTLMMIAQPAEERGAGAKAMLEEGLFTEFHRPDYNVAWHVSTNHPAGSLAMVPGWAMANVDSVDITVHGVGGHGSTPHVTKDPVVIASHIVVALQTIVAREIDPQDPAVVTVGSFHSGAKHNIISERAALQITVRSYSGETRDKLLSSIERIATNTARALGVPDEKLPEVKVKDEFTPSLYNDPELAARIRSVFVREFGEARIREGKPVMGGEDFARYGRQDPPIPSLMFRVGGTPRELFESSERRGVVTPGLHTPYFLPDAEPTITTAIPAMSEAAMELFAK